MSLTSGFDLFHAVLVVNELRSTSVHASFMAAFTPTHNVKIIPHSKMDDTFQHPNIQVNECTSCQHLCLRQFIVILARRGMLFFNCKRPPSRRPVTLILQDIPLEKEEIIERQV